MVANMKMVILCILFSISDRFGFSLVTVEFPYIVIQIFYMFIGQTIILYTIKSRQHIIQQEKEINSLACVQIFY